MPADLTPAPEWAVNLATQHLTEEAQEHWAMEEGAEARLARLLASVRDAAMREAAELCRSEARAWGEIPGTDNGAREVMCDDLSESILALVGTAPKDAP